MATRPPRHPKRWWLTGSVLGEAEGLGCKKMPWKELRVFEFGVEDKTAFSKSFGVSLLAHTAGLVVSEALPALR